MTITLAGRFEDALRSAGLSAAIVRASPESRFYGDGEVVASLDTVLLRLVRDRGEEFLDLGHVSRPDRFHQFGDVELAMGWRSLDDILAMRGPEPIHVVLERLRSKLPELREAFEADRAPITEKRIEEAERRRGDAVMGRLEGEATKSWLRWLNLAGFVLAWAVISAAGGYVVLALSTKECGWKPWRLYAVAAVALATLVLKGRAIIGSSSRRSTSRRRPAMLPISGLVAVLAPPMLALLFGTICNSWP
jgi:hypothetical protein